LSALHHATANDLLTLAMTIFQNLFSSSNSPKDDGKDTRAKDSARREGPETLPVKMDLEERMAFRRELLFETVKVSLSNNFIAPNTYRFKVMRTDKRGHCYVVMFDMSSDFMASEQGQHGQLTKLAAALTKNAQTRYGLVVGGVYWRVDETLAASVADWARPSAPAPLAAPLAAPQNPVATNIENYERVTAEELAEFEAAWQRDSDIKIGDRTYSSDLAPLGDDSHKS
jgi:hypothetical protein